MKILEILGVLAIGCVISFIAMHLWIFFCDSIIGGIKRLFGIKKKTINWHTLEGEEQIKTDIAEKKSHSDINNKLY